MPPPQPSGQDQIPSQKMSRPAAIEVDLWEMGRRKRVREVLGASDFCGELEQIIQSEIAKSYPENLNSVLQRSKQNLFAAPTTICFTGPQFLPHLPSLNVNQVLSTPAIPIADLSRSSQYLVEERRSRNKLATLYRLVDLFQWSQGIYNHITLRLPNTTDSAQILINPFGLLYHEITASSLIKLTLHGEVLDQGTTNLGVNQAAYVLHSAIHEARPDVHCVLHLHTAVVAAVASMRCGLLPICQEALIIGPVAYHDYQGILTDEEEKKSIVRDLGEKNVMILRNHGFVACGQSVEDALHLSFHTIIACETQIRAARVEIDNLIVPSEEAAKRAYETARRGGGGVNRINNNANQIENGQKQGNEQSKNFSYTTRTSWNIGELEWEAWCRVLDSSGFCTGHIYRNPQLRPAPPTYHSMYNLASIASLPNGPTSIGAINESEGVANWRLSMLRKEKERARWLNSPNQYQKMHMLETGTAHPRVVTRWVEQSAKNITGMIGGGTTVKIDSPHQFSPCGTDNREFKEQQRRLKQLRMAGTISPGPKSQLLERMTLDNAHNVVPAKKENGERSDAEWLQNNSKRPIYIGTASKGIIQRNQQMNAQVYRQLYAPNPFNTKSNDDLKKYLREVEEKKYKSQVIIDTTNSMPASPILKKLPESPSTDRASLAQAVARIKLNNEQHARSASEDGANQLSRDNEKFICEAIEANHGKENKKKGKKRRGIFFFGRKKSS